MTHIMNKKPFNRVFLLVDSKVSNSNSLHALTHSNTHASHVTGLSCNTYHMLTHTHVISHVHVLTLPATH